MLKSEHLEASDVKFAEAVVVAASAALFEAQSQGLIKFPGAGPEGFLPSQIGEKLGYVTQEFITKLEQLSPNRN